MADALKRRSLQRGPSIMMTAGLRRFTFTTHVTTSVGWVGAVIVFLVLAIIGLTSADERTIRGAYLVMAPAAWFVLVPLAFASLLSGLVVSLGTPWGIFRYYWVVFKLVITTFCTIILLIYMGTFAAMAAVAADPTVAVATIRNPSPIVHAALALLLLLIANVLAIYKPLGLTPYGIRMAPLATRGRVAAPADEHVAPWGRYVLATLIGLFALVVLWHLLGSGPHRLH